MKNKNIIIGLIIIIAAVIIVTAVLFFQGKEKQSDLLAQTNLASQEYVKLRYKTNELLTNAADYSSYDAWNAEMEEVIMRWENLESLSQILGKNAEQESNKISYKLFNTASAYNAQEITDNGDI